MNITVAPQNRTDPPRLLNYLTAPHVVVWSAAVCSSSVPGVFEPSILLVKDADGRWVRRLPDYVVRSYLLLSFGTFDSPISVALLVCDDCGDDVCTRLFY